MAAKKKVAFTGSKVTSTTVPKPQSTMDYAELYDGDFFLYKGVLYMKHDFDEQEALPMGGRKAFQRDWEEGMCGLQVIPVDVQINYTLAL